MKCGNSWMHSYVLLSCFHSSKDKFVDTRQLHSINGSMWRTFEAFSANLLFACHQWLGMSAPRNNTRPCLELTSCSYCSSFFFFNFGFTWYTRNYSTLLRPHPALKIRLGRGFRGTRVNLKNSFFLASSEEEVVWGHVLPGFCLDWQLCCPIPLLSSGSGGREKGLPAVPPRWMLQVVCEGAHVTTAGVSVVPISASPHHTSFNQKLHSKDTTGGTRGKKFRCTARGKNDLL